jgi:ferrous iron transport protein A
MQKLKTVFNLVILFAVSDFPHTAEYTVQTLAQLSIGARARVLGVTGAGATARRLLEMGVVPGAPVRVVKAAPLGDPLEVRVRNCHLALRRSEAATIIVQPE